MPRNELKPYFEKCAFVGLHYIKQKKYEKWKEVTKLTESLGLAVAVL
jgi:hypothetical protein